MPIALQAAERATGKTAKEIYKMMERGELLAKDFLVPFANAMRDIVRENQALQKATEKLTSQQNRLTTSYKELINEVFQSSGAEFFSNIFEDLADFIQAIKPVVVPVFDVVFKTLNLLWDIGKAVVDLTMSFVKLTAKVTGLGNGRLLSGLKAILHSIAAVVYEVIAGVHQLSKMLEGDFSSFRKNASFVVSPIAYIAKQTREAVLGRSSENNTSKSLTVQVDARGAKGDPEMIANMTFDKIVNYMGM